MAILSEESLIQADFNEWTEYKVLNDASVDETASSEVDARNLESVALFVESGAGVSGGVVELEGAPYSGYTGTWKQIGQLTINAASTLFAVSAVSGDDGIPCRVIRARISTVISGGTIDAYIITQK